MFVWIMVTVNVLSSEQRATFFTRRWSGRMVDVHGTWWSLTPETAGHVLCATCG